VREACERHGVPAAMTAATHASGSDRVWEVAQTRIADVYVNIQGDEPLITPGHIERLVTPFLTEAETQVSTLCIRATEDELPNPAVNKVVTGVDGYALYFSKFPIPYDRDGRGTARYKHIGLYAYRTPALEAFHALPPSPLELTERLEQLRFLEHGIRIRVMETDEPTIGVDTEDDVRAVEAWLAARTR
jgi:3-deoxy-manno-octulosonate cytidylyltransferase (CMP-KDO synthetase)